MASARSLTLFIVVKDLEETGTVVLLQPGLGFVFDKRKRWDFECRNPVTVVFVEEVLV
jgi:hypothetical protein